jgi:aminoglycoside phosphotransferase
VKHAKVIHDGHVVRRKAHENEAFVRETLRFLEAQRFEGAPRYLGTDEHGRELVSFVAGDVREESALSDEQIANAARLLRRFHDVVAGSELAGEEEIVCHGDAGPHNVVFHGDQAIALIDWEFAEPGSRLTELAVVAWLLVDDRWKLGQGEAAARRIHLFCSAYGWDEVGHVIDELSVLVRRARHDHAKREIAESVDHFTKLLAWLSEHESQLKDSTRLAG